MKKKYILGIFVVSVITLITSISYAVWQITLQQESTNIVSTACFQINFMDSNNIQLLESYPISDESGMSLTPYTFTIENVCSTNATYQINLEELTTELKKLSQEYIKVSLNNSKGKILNTYETVEKTLSDAESSKKLTTGVLKASESKSFDLRLWMDENTPAIPDVMNANFLSKITIIAVQKEGLPEVSIVAKEKQDGITVDISTIENPKNETLKYFYQLNEEEEIESNENTHTFTGLSDGKYKVSVRAETLSGVILEEKELDVTVAYEQVYVSSSGNDETGNGAIDNPFSTLQPAYNKVKSGGEILLLSDITATETTNMNIENKEVILKSNGKDIYTVLKEQPFNGSMLRIENQKNITIEDLIFDGNKIFGDTTLIYLEASTLNLNKGTEVKNGRNSNCLGAGVSLFEKSTLNLMGGKIIGNTVSGCSNSQGGGIYAHVDNFVNIFDGEVSDNSSSYIGGGIFIWGSVLNIYGGSISNNSASYGGGIWIGGSTNDSTMTMTAGSIINNTASGDGGGITANRDTNNISVRVYISGGTIANNSAPDGANWKAWNGAEIIDER